MLFPNEIKAATSAMDHETRWRIVELLNYSGKLAYTELLQKLEVRKGSLNHHLMRLMEAGIIDNYPEGAFRGPYNSFYQLSAFGKDFISGLLSSVEFRLPIEMTKPQGIGVTSVLPATTIRDKSVSYASVAKILKELITADIQHQKPLSFNFDLRHQMNKQHPQIRRYRMTSAAQKFGRCDK